MSRTQGPAREATKHHNQAKFLAAFSRLGHIGKSCEAAGIERTCVWDWRRDDEFEAKYLEALDRSVGTLEDEALRRAVDGTEENVYHNGMACGTVRKYSDVLLIFLLKGARPERYRDNVRAEIVGKNGGPVEYRDMTTADLQHILTTQLALQAAKAKKDEPT
jgi:hypothetical protein